MVDDIFYKDYQMNFIGDPSDLDEAEAAITTNKQFNYLKFILTDDGPNANNQRVPPEEFPNLLKTGVYAPFKMAAKEIKDGHEEAIPLGVITHLKQEGNQIRGIAALWSRERPQDVEMLKQAYAQKLPINVSWEIQYAESKYDDAGIENLYGTSLRGATVVGMPAYEGRTPVIAFASVETEPATPELSESAVWTTAYINNLPDSAFLYVESGGKKDSEGKTVPRTLRHLPYKDANGKIDLAHLRNALARIPQSNLSQDIKDKLTAKAKKLLESANASLEDKNLDELETLKAQLADFETKLADAQKKLDETLAQLSNVEAEASVLREYKASIEAEQAKIEKMASIKTKFSEAGLEKDEQYFVDNAKMLMALDETTLDFMIQELVAFSATTKEGKSSKQIPNVPANDSGEKFSPKDLAKALREHNTKKENK